MLLARTTWPCLSSLGLVCALAGGASAQVTYVDATAGGAGTGTSWTDAYVDLQPALASTSSGEVWVAAGTYHPGPAGARTATFALQSGVQLYGGFAGGETSVAQRDVAAHETILSGDINQDDTYGTGLNWWQFNWNGNAGNSYHVVTGTGADATAVLDGFTILAGVGADPANHRGGGLLVLGGSPTLRNTTFRYNAVGFGSAAYLDDCGSTFESCMIRDGYTCNCGAGGWTSGVVATGTSDVTFIGCTFFNHYYVSSQSQGRGAALNLDFGTQGTVIDCRFEKNQTGNFYPIGGGTARGAGLNAHGDVVVDRCVFVDNFAHAGAGMTAWGDAIVTNSVFTQNRAVTHPESGGIDVGDYGAGLLTVGSGSNTIEITNCTFVDNNCSKGAGMALLSASVAKVRNCVVYDNYANPPEPGEDTIWILKQNLTGNYDIAYSDVEGLLQTEPGEDPPNPANFPGCIDTDPMLVGSAADAASPAAGSPCIDAGDSGALATGLDLDVIGAPRRVDDAATADTGVGPAPVVDMGAFEFGAVPSPWVDLGLALAGTSGAPILEGAGPFTGGSTATLTLTQAAPSAAVALILGVQPANLPFLGGTLVPTPDLLLFGLGTDGAGTLVLAGPLPAAVPSGVTIFFQAWITDSAGPMGYSASNGLAGTLP